MTDATALLADIAARRADLTRAWARRLDGVSPAAELATARLDLELAVQRCRDAGLDPDRGTRRHPTPPVLDDHPPAAA